MFTFRKDTQGAFFISESCKKLSLRKNVHEINHWTLIPPCHPLELLYTPLWTFHYSVLDWGGWYEGRVTLTTTRAAISGAFEELSSSWSRPLNFKKLFVSMQSNLTQHPNDDKTFPPRFLYRWSHAQADYLCDPSNCTCSFTNLQLRHSIFAPSRARKLKNAPNESVSRVHASCLGWNLSRILWKFILMESYERFKSY